MWACPCAVSGELYLLIGICLLAVETYLLTGILATSDDALQKRGPVLLRTCQAVAIGDNFSMDTLGQ